MTAAERRAEVARVAALLRARARTHRALAVECERVALEVETTLYEAKGGRRG